MVTPSFLEFEQDQLRLDLRYGQVWHLSVRMAQKVAGGCEKQWLRPAPLGSLPVQADG
jgi:hypothetical protein